MKNNVFRYLKNYSSQPKDVDRLIISSFFKKNNLAVQKNEFLKSFIISENNKEEYEKLTKFISVLDIEVPKFGMEDLIELFEFVVSPADRVVNGAIYTPLNIREFIIKQTFQSKKDTLETCKIADISCGCGGFLVNAAKRLKNKTNRTYAHIFRYQIFGLDIQAYSVKRAKILLSILALNEGEDKKEFHFNLFVGDALTCNWKRRINNFSGFDIVLGNPPYVCLKNMDEKTRAAVQKFEICKSGNTDLYIPFFKLGIDNLSESGVLGFITMNSFFKSLNGRDLRKYFQELLLNFKIIDFSTEQVFKSRNTYTCICLIKKTKQKFIRYAKCESKNLSQQLSLFSKIEYSSLDAKQGWNLQDSEIISKIESTGVSFGDLYTTRNGIATLNNEIYIFNPVNHDEDYYYLQNGSLYPIEKEICRDIVNSNKISSSTSTTRLNREKVIFPYDNNDKPKLLEENFIRENFPKAYKYLSDKKKKLSERDKGNGEYEKWFAFGRTQSLERMRTKLFFPKMANRTPNYIISSDDDLLFYNGLAIVGHSRRELEVIKKIMESKLFWYYIKTTSKPYSSDYYSLSGNYIRNFGVCNLDEEEKEYVLREENKSKLETFFAKKYGIKVDAL
jgi:adenine-specific DNA-methyltransferase